MNKPPDTSLIALAASVADHLAFSVSSIRFTAQPAITEWQSILGSRYFSSRIGGGHCSGTIGHRGLPQPEPKIGRRDWRFELPFKTILLARPSRLIAIARH